MGTSTIYSEFTDPFPVHSYLYHMNIPSKKKPVKSAPVDILPWYPGREICSVGHLGASAGKIEDQRVEQATDAEMEIEDVWNKPYI